MINKDSFYLQDIELLKQLQPIMAKKGIEADGVIFRGELYRDVRIEHAVDINQNELPGYCAHFLVQCEDGAFKKSWVVNAEVKTWRKDSLEAALPEWTRHFCIAQYEARLAPFITIEVPIEIQSKLSKETRREIHHLCNDSITFRFTGEESLKALGELIVLLDKEGVE